MLDPENEAARADQTTRATPEVTLKPDHDAVDARQKKADRGSWSPDDPNRRRWDATTSYEAEYPYRRLNGTIAFVKYKGRCADGEKVFATGRPFESGSSAYAMAVADDPRAFFDLEGLRHVLKGKGETADLLYRLDELVRDTEADREAPVYIPEGEKDVDTLRALGFIATTNPDGWKKWSDDYGEHLRYRHIVLLIDNDKNGEQRGELLPVRLWRYAKSIKVIRLPDLPPKGDVTDWIEAGNSKEALLKIVEETPPWQPFERDEDGNPYKSSGNARLSLDLLGVTVRYDEFAHRFVQSGLPNADPVLGDKDVTHLRIIVGERCGLKYAKDAWWDYVTDYAHRRAFHPVRDYLDARRWDGVPRLDTWLSHYGGAEDNEYTRAVSAIPLIAGVRRVRKPGCKFDEVLVLEGAQGGNKSGALRALATRDEWFVDSLPLGADSKVVMEQIAGGWLIEFAEMSGLNKSDVENVKSQVARQFDKARMSYGRLTTERPRQCVFFGTTNADQYLRDPTGNRRFWPVKVDRFDLDALRRDRDQIWAEAAAREATGESIRLAPHLWAVAGEHQAKRLVRDTFFDTLADLLDGAEGKVRAEDIWAAVGLEDKAKRTQAHGDRLHAAMTRLGWRRPPDDRLRFAGKRVQAWAKGDASIEVPRAILFPADDGRPM
ncbi:virulence-associated E family protein [Sphingomonas melonis]|uniref:Virulence-associated protein E-like domain-containing protein n=1 Tax=Sphingomonas melonis TaxID=152682 RepID=A0A7Y9FR30_9SPHN|nr:virulence-associated E family protein [Sphingomonas melonis]NYD91632.1 hypothetical protein [Sphingomonas melonis]